MANFGHLDHLSQQAQKQARRISRQVGDLPGRPSRLNLRKLTKTPKNDQNTQILTPKSGILDISLIDLWQNVSKSPRAQNGQKWPFWSNPAKSLDPAPGQGAGGKVVQSSQQNTANWAPGHLWPGGSKCSKTPKMTKNDHFWSSRKHAKNVKNGQKWPKMAILTILA